MIIIFYMDDTCHISTDKDTHFARINCKQPKMSSLVQQALAKFTLMNQKASTAFLQD